MSYTHYDHQIDLVASSYTFDGVGNQIPTTTKTTVLCRLGSVGRREFYDASVAGLKPELLFIIHAYEYGGQMQVEFEGVQYNVIRTYRTEYEEMELVCERVIGSDD